MELRLSLADRSLTSFPAASNGEFGLPDRDAVVIERGEGCELWDATGRRYIDFSMGWGSALVGHARREIREAVSKQLVQRESSLMMKRAHTDRSV